MGLFNSCFEKNDEPPEFEDIPYMEIKKELDMSRNNLYIHDRALVDEYKKILHFYENYPYRSSMILIEIESIITNFIPIMSSKYTTGNLRTHTIVCDIDDTLLFTTPHSILYSIFGFGVKEPILFDDPVGFDTDPFVYDKYYPLIEDVHKFLRYAKEIMRYSVFFVTTRKESSREWTENNLKIYNIEYDGIYFHPNCAIHTDCHCQCVDDTFKMNARRDLVDKGYNILFTIGDRCSDFTGGYTGIKIHLPNPAYTFIKKLKETSVDGNKIFSLS